MTKNTKANITLIFSIVRKSGELAKALEAISRQTDKNCHLIFVFNGCGASEKDIFKKFDFRGFEKVEYVFLSENLGDVYTYQYVERNNNLAKYHYLFDSNIVLMPNFVATLNKFVNEHPEADVVSFFGVPNTYFKDEYITINTLSDDFCHRPLTFFNNKLIRVGFLKENKIVQKKFKTYPTLFYIKVAMANPKWYSIGEQICTTASKPTYSFNIMDLFDQCQICVDNLGNEWFAEHYAEIEYLCVVSLLSNFVNAVFKKNKSNLFFQKRILNRIESFMEQSFPLWNKNVWLHSEKNKNDKQYLGYLRDFKPKLLYVLRALRKKY